MEPIKTFTSRVVPLPAENVDTDQIIPAPSQDDGYDGPGR